MVTLMSPVAVMLWANVDLDARVGDSDDLGAPSIQVLITEGSVLVSDTPRVVCDQCAVVSVVPALIAVAASRSPEIWCGHDRGRCNRSPRSSIPRPHTGLATHAASAATPEPGRHIVRAGATVLPGRGLCSLGPVVAGRPGCR